LLGDGRVDESLGGGSGASEIKMERSLDQRDFVRATVRNNEVQRDEDIELCVRIVRRGAVRSMARRQ
jgi:hypothetical protein